MASNDALRSMVNVCANECDPFIVPDAVNVRPVTVVSVMVRALFDVPRGVTSCAVAVILPCTERSWTTG